MEFKALIENINNELTDVRNSNESLEENINKGNDIFVDTNP